MVDRYVQVLYDQLHCMILQYLPYVYCLPIVTNLVSCNFSWYRAIPRMQFPTFQFMECMSQTCYVTYDMPTPCLRNKFMHIELLYFLLLSILTSFSSGGKRVFLANVNESEEITFASIRSCVLLITMSHGNQERPCALPFIHTN